jgi:hypothetical protein
LIEELQCHPVGLLAADLLGKMGHLSRPAFPELRRIIDSEVRLVQLAAIDEWVDLDELPVW